MPLSKAALERLVEASPDIVVATDSNGTVAYYNDGARENLGYSREEIIGREVRKLYPSIEEARRVMAAMRSPEGGAGRIVSFPTTFVHKDGRELPVAISGVIVRDAGGTEEGTIGFAKDLSDIIRKDQLAVLGEVAIGLSHEINNPLTAIASDISLLERFVVAQERAEGSADELSRLARIRREIRRIEIHLDRLREMAGKQEYSRTRYLGDQSMIDLSERGPLAGRHLLVVDDDSAVLESVVDFLRAEGCNVDACSNGKDAAQRVRCDRYDLVLSDVVMPGMDGYELLLETRKVQPETKVILMTAFYHDQDHILKRSRLEGLEGVLFKKPLDPERLRNTLVELLG